MENASLPDWISAITAVVVGLFAILQVALAVRERRDRTMIAYSVVWAEWSRLLMVVGRWEQEDLVALTDNGALDAGEVVPADWSHLSTHLAQVGPATSRYGGAAYMMLTGAARNVAVLKHAVAMQPLVGRTPDQHAALEDLAGRTKMALRDGVLLLEDALAASPAWVRSTKIDLGAPTSEMGRALAGAAEDARRGKSPRSAP